MGFQTVTTVKCSKPGLVAQGSDFYNEWTEFRMKNNDGEEEYFCGYYYVLEAIEDLSSRYPDQIFTGVTWRTDEIEDCKQRTVVYKAGNTIDIKIRPKYTYLSEVHAWG